MTDYYILHSGGLASTTCLTLATTYPDARNIYSIGVNYGQRHLKELEAAKTTAELLSAQRITLDLTGYGKSVHSALTDPNIAVPTGSYNQTNMNTTVVPGRNAVMLAAVAGLAASNSKTHPATIIIGVHGGDHHIYPDCRPDFIHAQTTALKLATGVNIQAPFLHKTKTDIIKTGHKLGAPLHLTWSCYNNHPHHCGQCGTCQERKQAFHQAHIPDPTHYEQ